MSRERLTPDRIRRFSCPADRHQAFLWDTESPRLAVRATANAKSFIFETKLNRKTVRQTIGDVRNWTIEAARSEARRLQTLVDQGVDPRREKAARLAKEAAVLEQKAKAELTVADVWQTYLQARQGKWSERHYRDHVKLSALGGEKRQRRDAKTEPGALAALMSLPFASLDADTIKDWLTAETAKRPTQAALAYRLLRAFVRWCSESKDFAEAASPEAVATRAVREELPKARAKDDCLQREQLAPWFEKVRKIPNPTIAAYLQILLLTGARRGELVGLKWDDVDFQWKSLTIRDKVEGERTIPLTPYAADLLTDLKRRNEAPPKVRKLRGADDPTPTPWAPSPWVFSSPTSASGRLQEPSIQHRRACAEAGLDGLTLHGLRRSFGTLSEWVEVPTGIVAQIMGHKPSAIAEKHYRRRPLDLLRLWHSKIEAWILDQAGIEQPTRAEAPIHVVASGAERKNGRLP